MNIIMMVVAFLLITGLAVMLSNMMRLYLMEGVFLTASAIIFMLYITAHLGILSLGLFILIILMVVSWILLLFLALWDKIDKTNNRNRLGVKGLPAYYALAIIFIFSIILYNGDFIQHIDELHLWALMPKYLYTFGKLPEADSMMTLMNQNIGTSYFHYFFQRIAGYNEGMMYVSAVLLYWIGFLLPFSKSNKKSGRNIVLYCVILYVGLYSLHYYGNKSLYVDIPVAAWAGGMIAWLSTRPSRTKQLTLMLPALFVVYDLKKSVGWLMDLFILIYFVILCVNNKQNAHEKTNRKLTKHLLGAINGIFTVFFAIVMFIFMNESMYGVIPGSMRENLLLRGLSKQKVMLTLSSFIEDLFGQSFTIERSSFRITSIYLLVICVVLVLLIQEHEGKSRETGLRLAYILTIWYIYNSLALIGFLVKTSYDSATRTIASQRYLSIIGIVIFCLCLFWLLGLKGDSKKKQLYISLALIVMFSQGFNSGYLTNTTSWNQNKVDGYRDIKEIRRETKIIHSLIDENDMVYFLDQNRHIKDEFATNAATYYMTPQISNYRLRPRAFTQKGAWIAVWEVPYTTINIFPQILADNNFSYLWIYNVDDFLKEKLREVFEMDEDLVIAKGQLYKIKATDGNRLKLELVTNMIKFDDRFEYEETN